MEEATNNEIYTRKREHENEDEDEDEDEDASTVTKLKRPTALFEKIVHIQLRTFNRCWSHHWKSETVLHDITFEMRRVTTAMFPDWFDETDPCMQHRLYALNFLMKVKLYSRTRYNN